MEISALEDEAKGNFEKTTKDELDNPTAGCVINSGDLRKDFDVV